MNSVNNFSEIKIFLGIVAGMAATSTGLRERKKAQTEARLWRIAVDMFVERGFDQVSVAEIAAAAEVSKVTVFNYFPTKEDLVMSAPEQHVDDLAAAVRERPPGLSVVAALRAQFLDALDRRDPAVGFSDEKHILDVLRLIMDTPALRDRAHAMALAAEAALADELVALSADHDPLIAAVAAAQLAGTRRCLAAENHRRLLAGQTCEQVLPDATANAIRAFAVVERGLGTWPG
jgi:AcrR family transcriptional regulator